MMKHVFLRRVIFALAVGWAGVLVGQANSTDGAWKIEGESDRVMLVVDGYWTQTFYDRENRQFFRTMGGPVWENGEAVAGKIDFDSADPQQVGQRFSVRTQSEGNRLDVVLEDGTRESWVRVDDADGPLAGVWRITGRMTDTGMTEMPLRARRTLKVLTGTRFQWIAMNVETGEFSGTGGGTYTFKDGKYVETIEFFSRDASRVGASLEFSGEVKDGVWHHGGKSSRGDPIDERWSAYETDAR